MEEIKIYKKIIDVSDNYQQYPEYPENPEYITNQTNNEENISFENKEINDKSNSYIPYHKKQNSPTFFNVPNSINATGPQTSSKIYSSKKIYKNYIQGNNNNYSTISNPLHPKNSLYLSSDLPVINTPIYYTNDKLNKYNINNLHNNNSQISQIGYTTDEGENNINYNNCNNNYNNQYLSVSSAVLGQEEEDKGNTYESNVEQLIIYPENDNFGENEKYFDPMTKEGELKNKNYETYKIDCIEYYSNEKYKNKPVSFLDYVLKNKNKKLKKTKSCDNININKRNINSYEIKYFTNRKKDSQNKIKTIPINLNKKKEKKIVKVLEHFRDDHSSIKNKNNFLEKKGVVINFSNDEKIYKKAYNTNYNIKRIKNKYIKFPKWKIVASACLIQNWWKSLKILYKKYLNKIIVLQKVYKIHYKNKHLLKEKRSYYKPNNKNFDEINTSNKISKYNKFKSKHMKEQKKIYNNKYIYNKPNINQFDKKNEYSFSSINSYKNKYNIGILLLKKILENYLIKVYSNIISNIKNNINVDNINDNIRGDKTMLRKDKKNKLERYPDDSESVNISSDKGNDKKLVNINIKPNNNISFSDKNDNFKNIFNPEKISIINNYSFSIIKENDILENKLNESSYNNINIPKKEINSEYYENNILHKQKNKNKIESNNLNTNKSINNYTFNKEHNDNNNNTLENNINIKNNSNQNDNKNLKNLSINDKYNKLVYSIRYHINKYILDKIKNEVKRRKLIVCFKNINLKKYPNLHYALKKIKKYAKVRYIVMNEYASIIQNAFRYYQENKMKEQNQNNS